MITSAGRVKPDYNASGAEYQLFDEATAPIPFAQWARFEDRGVFAAVAVLAGLEQSGVAALAHDGATLSIDAYSLATLDEELATAIGLPAPVPFTLQIESHGALGRLRLETRWIDADGLRVRAVEACGVLLRARDAEYRLASPIFEIVRAVDAFNQKGDAPPNEQAEGWAEIQELIGIDREHIQAGRFLERIRVARASRFTLDFVPDEGGGFQIAPVPLGIDRRRKRDAEKTDRTQLDRDDAAREESVRLLSADEQKRFQRAFKSRPNAQAAYLGGDDVFVVVAPEVRRCLEVVRRMQERPADERLTFARNPFPFLRGDDTSDAELPFVESRSFSDRVLGLGKLEKVVLPWQILQSQGWLPPETVSVWLSQDRKIAVAPETVEPAIVDIERAIATGRPAVRVGEHEVPAVPESRDAFLDARKALDERAASDLRLEPAVTKSPAVTERIGLQVKRNLEESEYDTSKAKRAAVPFDLPEIETTLKGHQTEAVAWLQRRWSAGYRGALLADDMGLGKTLSALTFMMWLRRAMLDGHLAQKPMLVVAPVSLLQNWSAEHERHIGQNDVRFVDIVRAWGATLPKRQSGRDIDSGAAMLDLDRLTVDRFGKPTCVLTTYETLRDYQQSFAAINFGIIVLDEVQRIKNAASLSWHAVSAQHGDFWLALTGTPVENRLADLWAIADAIEPNFLGTLREFSATYESAFDEARLRELKTSLEVSPDGAQFMLRRLKEHVLDGLPQKHEHLQARPMPPAQATAYTAVVEEGHAVKSRGQMLGIVQKMREISLHPLRPTAVEPEAYIAGSARFQALFSVLDTIAQTDEKVLIFLDRNAVEAFLARLIQQRYGLERLPSIINGEVAGQKRHVLVDQFQNRSGFDVMLLSPRAGGVGITLTAANHVIHLSRWWNPAVEDQSTDRAYRIGQRKAVHVYYLQATLPGHPNQSFDERLHSLLQKKRELSRDLLWPFSTDEGDAATLLGEAVDLEERNSLGS